LPTDIPDPLVRRALAVGRYMLVLGDRAGTAVVAVGGGDLPPPLAQPILPASGREESLPLAEALAQARRERDPQQNGTKSIKAVADDAAEVSGKVERVVALFTEIAEGRRDPASISDEVDVLCGLLQRLDRDGRWEEALRVARALAMLLALLGRWIQLLRSLQIAVGAAERLVDDSSKAWALHEQGTWQLVADRHAEADALLGAARDLRAQIGDRRGLAMTERNLQALCRVLRAGLHAPVDPPPVPPPESWIEQILDSPPLVAILAVLLLGVGGAAGAIIASDADSANSVASGPSSKTTAAQTAGNSTPAVAGQGTGSTTSPAPTGTTSSKSAGEGSASEESHTLTSTKGSNAPAAPSAPVRVIANVRETSVALAWTAPADGGDAITSYTITPYVGAEAQTTTRLEGSPPATSTTVSGLASGTSYTFTVTAKNAIGEGPASEHSNAVTP
jgi:hypothetical protein